MLELVVHNKWDQMEADLDIGKDATGDKSSERQSKEGEGNNEWSAHCIEEERNN